VEIPSAGAAYATELGKMYQARIEDFLAVRAEELKGKVNLVFFSPPFPLNRKKKYGNKVGTEYLEWLGKLAPQLADLLTEDGSLVVEIGNAWDPGTPTMSLLPLQSLMTIAEKGKLQVCQQFICNNTARLPGPAAWVTVRRIRVKDSYTHVWWMSRTTEPKADNLRVLTPYSESMKKLLKRGNYNHGPRGSEHVISEKGFLTDHGGAIASNVFNYSNTVSGTAYRKYCEKHGLKPHPASMQEKLVEWFIQFLTDKGDLVLDPFGGSNMTGAVSEALGRRWIAVEPEESYVAGSRGRFDVLRDAPSDI
jgi:DNA methylase